jgi:hypothetical protein
MPFNALVVRSALLIILRVIKLGEFSPNYFRQFFRKITEVAQIFWLLFSTAKGMYILILTKNVVGYIWGVLMNSSGHPFHRPVFLN